MKPAQASTLNSRLRFSTFVLCFFFCSPAHAVPPPHEPRNNNPLNIQWGPAPSPEDGPPASANALRDPAYLPYQIGAIVGSYGVSLVLVAVLLLVLSKRRREALSAGDDEIDFDEPKSSPRSLRLTLEVPNSPRSIPRSPVRNFSYPSPEDYQDPGPSPQTPYVAPTPTSTLHAPGTDFSVDQRVVQKDKKMAQTQLEEMYKYVMEQEEAKAQGITLRDSPVLASGSQFPPPNNANFGKPTLKKEKHKPANLNLSEGKPEKQSRASSIFSALRSPKKNKHVKGISISSPIMTPMTGTFPGARQESQEMNAIPPRQYAPPPPPPVPTNQVPYGVYQENGQVSPITPDLSPESTQSIDERIGAQISIGHARKPSAAPSASAASEVDPNSATTERSTAPLIGLPQSPKPGARFPTLPASPKPGATFAPSLPSSPQPGATFRSKAPSAVRTGGALPLRAYEPALSSPSMTSQTTKQTVFTRTGPLSPSGARTPATGMAVPYSPYQPFTPIVPMTPLLVTKADRKRMKRLEPKTPTLEMVKSEDDIW